ncbi:MAG: hypothetical protein ACE5HJ_04815 [Thermoplasmata archaeon]
MRCDRPPCFCVPGYRPGWGPRTKEEVAQELEDYKEHLELEIRELERKIKSLGEKASE